jgi:dTDP-4-amino-4,6-dideoxygalactose transaminase
LKALGVGGEVITTPFSYVATSSCSIWEGCQLSYVDIEEDCWTIDPAVVEASITPSTEAILATHVFGCPVDVAAISAIAEKNGLAVIYDAAHAFGVRYNGKSLLNWGDLSFLSLHATKLIHSVEGGAVVARDPSVASKVEWMRRFAHNGPEAFHGVGINAKMSELHAAMGLCVLKRVDSILRSRSLLSEAYDMSLPACIRPFRTRVDATQNYSYYPVLFEDEAVLLDAVRELQAANIYPRRYFYPLLSQLKELQTCMVECPVAESVASRVLCLPMMAVDNAEVFAEQVIVRLRKAVRS